MALNRRSANRFSANIWPGFVDAMTALLLVLMFVLTIFMVVQFVLRETITGQDEELDSLSSEISSLSAALGLEQNRSANLQGNVDLLRANLEDSKARADQQAAMISSLNAQSEDQLSKISALSTQNQSQAARIADFEQQVASLLARNTDLATSLDQSRARVAVLTEQSADAAQREAALSDQNSLLLADKDALEKANLAVISERDALQLALVQARSEIDESAEMARLAAAKREALEAVIADLQSSATQKDRSLADALALLAATQGDLDTSKNSLTEALAQLGEASVRAGNLSRDLGAVQGALDAEKKKNNALEGRVAVLSDTQAALANEAAALQQTKEELAQAQAALAATRSDLAEVQTSLDTSTQRLADTELELSGSSANLVQMRTELGNKTAELEKTQSELAQARSALQSRGLTEAELRKKLEQLVNGLSEAEKAKLAEAAAAAALREKLKNAEDELTAMTLSLETQRKEAEDTLTLLAAAKAAAKKADLTASKQLSEAQKKEALLAVAREELLKEKVISFESARKVTLLNEQTTELRKQLDNLQGLLDSANAADLKSKVQIEALGANLNTALARVASEQKKLAQETEKRAALEAAERKRLEAETKDLKKFKSEFFGRLRDVLGSREGIRIVGDRFVFSSEILFRAGSAELGDRGKKEIAKVANIILDVADQIPKEIDWVLRVDGHTDKIPLSGRGAYADNWELSQARALSVVKYLISDLGVPANRLAANGFGEFQPIVDGSSPEALALNRRIELKFTEK